MPVDYAYRLAPVYIPYNNEMIEAGAEQHVISYRMPLDVSDTSLVPLQLHQPIGQVS